IPRRRRRAVGCNVSDQPVAALRDGLDDAGLLRVIAKYAPEIRDATGEHIVGNECVGPNSADEQFLRDYATGMCRQAHEYLHRFWLEASGALGAGDAVERWLDVMRCADVKTLVCGHSRVDRNLIYLSAAITSEQRTTDGTDSTDFF